MMITVLFAALLVLAAAKPVTIGLWVLVAIVLILYISRRRSRKAKTTTRV